MASDQDLLMMQLLQQQQPQPQPQPLPIEQQAVIDALQEQGPMSSGGEIEDLLSGLYGSAQFHPAGGRGPGYLGLLMRSGDEPVGAPAPFNEQALVDAITMAGEMGQRGTPRRVVGEQAQQQALQHAAVPPVTKKQRKASRLAADSAQHVVQVHPKPNTPEYEQRESAPYINPVQARPFKDELAELKDLDKLSVKKRRIEVKHFTAADPAKETGLTSVHMGTGSEGAEKGRRHYHNYQDRIWLYPKGTPRESMVRGTRLDFTLEAKLYDIRKDPHGVLDAARKTVEMGNGPRGYFTGGGFREDPAGRLRRDDYNLENEMERILGKLGFDGYVAGHRGDEEVVVLLNRDLPEAVRVGTGRHHTPSYLMGSVQPTGTEQESYQMVDHLLRTQNKENLIDAAGRATSLAERSGVYVSPTFVTNSLGYWQGSYEASGLMKVKGSDKDIARYASLMATSSDQDSVGSFRAPYKNESPNAILIRGRVELSMQEAVDAMDEMGIDGMTMFPEKALGSQKESVRFLAVENKDTVDDLLKKLKEKGAEVFKRDDVVVRWHVPGEYDDELEQSIVEEARRQGNEHRENWERWTEEGREGGKGLVFGGPERGGASASSPTRWEEKVKLKPGVKRHGGIISPVMPDRRSREQIMRSRLRRALQYVPK